MAITAAAILLAIAQRDPVSAFEKVEWSLLLFFGALFVVMRGARDLPMIASLTSAAGAQLRRTDDDAVVTSAAMLALSNLVSNVPAVVSVAPRCPQGCRTIVHLARDGDELDVRGNLTLLGSMANLIVAERAKRAESGWGSATISESGYR